MSTVRALALVSLAGCIVQADDLLKPRAVGDIDLYVEPPSATDTTSLITITDDHRELDFRDVWDVRSLGDFAILEWSDHSDRIEVVIEIDPGTLGEQSLALDTYDGAMFTSFEVY